MKNTIVISLVSSLILSSCGKTDKVRVTTCQNYNDATVELYYSGQLAVERNPDAVGTTNTDYEDENYFIYEEDAIIQGNPVKALVVRGDSMSNYGGNLDNDFDVPITKPRNVREEAEAEFCLTKNYFPLFTGYTWLLGYAKIDGISGGTLASCREDNYLNFNYYDQVFTLVDPNNDCSENLTITGDIPSSFPESSSSTSISGDIISSDGTNTYSGTISTMEIVSDSIKLKGTIDINGSTKNVEYHFGKQ